MNLENMNYSIEIQPDDGDDGSADSESEILLFDRGEGQKETISGDDRTRCDTRASNRTIIWATITSISLVACYLFYFHGWRTEERQLLQKLADLEPIATVPSEDYRDSVAILNNDVGYQYLEISNQLHDLRYANDASYRKRHDSSRKLSDLSERELEEILAKLDPDSETVNALHLLSPRSADKSLQDRSLLETQLYYPRSDAQFAYPTYSLSEFLIGIDRHHEDVIDVSFVEDILPEETVLRATGRSAHLECGIRIFGKKPILILKLIHIHQRGKLDIERITVTTAQESVTYNFDPKMVSQQPVDQGTIEFATMVPSHDEDAEILLAKLVGNTEICSVEVIGANDCFTTFTPTRENMAHTIALADLYLKLLRDPALLDRIAERALPNELYLERIQGALSLDHPL